MHELKTWLNGERGRRTSLAKQLGITSGALSQWTQVPSERALEVERITGVSRHELRPDVFGAAPSKQGAAA